MDTRRSILSQLLVRAMSLADLGVATGTSLPTLRRAVQDLRDGHWIHVMGREAATGGRPANLFGIDGSVHTVVGVHLAHPGMRMVATDLAGQLLTEAVLDEEADLDPETAHGRVLDFVGHVRARWPQRRILGVGVATPGYVDPQTGTVITIGRVPNWDNLPLRERLREATGARVSIGNDMDAMAVAEFGLGEDPRTYAYVGYGEGVKFSAFLAGVPYVGPFGNAGLVGPHLLAEGGGRAAAAVLTTRGVVAAFERETRDGDTGSSVARMRFADVLAEAERGEPTADRLMGRVSEVLGAQIASFVHLFQPSLLVIGGALAPAPPGVHARIEAAVRRRLPTLLDNNLIVRRARVIGDDGAALGAARVCVQRFLHEETDPLDPA